MANATQMSVGCVVRALQFPGGGVNWFHPHRAFRSWLAVGGAVWATTPGAGKLAHERRPSDHGKLRLMQPPGVRRGAAQRKEVRRMTMPDVSAQLEATTTRVKELSDQVAAQAKENGLAWLEGYEKVLKNMLDLEDQVAGGTGLDWATRLATIHANFVRDTSEVLFSTLDKQLKS